MALIPLTKGLAAIVDETDVPMLSRYRWFAQGSPGKYYAATKTGTKGKTVYMHHLLLAVTDPSMERDHINGDRLDNRRGNLRLVTHAQNQMNVRYTRSRSGLKGAQQSNAHGKFRSSIVINGKSKHLGVFATKEAAAEAYAKAAAGTYGEYACIEKTA